MGVFQLADLRARRLPLLVSLHSQFNEHGDTAEFTALVCERYSFATLEKLAEFGSREVRRAATHALGLAGDYSVNEQLGRRMRDSDRGVRLLAERFICGVWFRVGSAEQRHQLLRIEHFNSQNQPNEAMRLASNMLATAPDIAEFWNQRSVAYAILNDPLRSKQDSHQALELNPYHFSAAVNMGNCYLELKDRRGALEAYRRALGLNPNLEGVRARILLLQKGLGQE
jgi:tetratricopeptide (TPR) repeat protein